MAETFPRMRVLVLEAAFVVSLSHDVPRDRHDVLTAAAYQWISGRKSERGTQALVQHAHSVLVGYRARLRRVIYKIIAEQFLEHAPVTLALYFLGVPANYGDCCIAHG